MQGQKSSIDSFREAIDIGQGSDSNSGAMNNQQTSLNSLIPPVERRWSSYVSPGEACVNAGNEVQNFAATSESSGSSIRNHVGDEGFKMEHGRPSSFGAHHAGSMTEEILFPPRAIVSLGGNQLRSGASFAQGSSSNHVHQSVNLNEGYVESSGNSEPGLGASSLGPNLYLSSRLERESASGSAVASDIVGTSSGSSGCMMGESDGSSGPLGNWGLSCKRKALEGTSGQSCAGGSSSSFVQPEHCAWHTGPARYSPSNGLRLSSPPIGSPSEHQNPRTGITTGSVASDAFPSSSVTGNAGISLRQVGGDSNAGSRHESIPFNLASAGSARRFSLRHSPFSDQLDLRSTPVAGPSSGAPQSQPHMLYNPALSGNNHTFPWTGASSSRVGSMSSSFPFGERGTEVREEASLRSIPRTSVEHPMFVSASELRNSAHDPTSSSLASGNTSPSLGIPSSSRIASSSSNPLVPSPPWIPHHNSSAQNRQRTLEFAPWSLFPSVDSQPGPRSSHPDPLLAGPSSSRDTTMSSGRGNQSRQQPYLRSAFLADRQGEDALNISNSLRVLSADIEGRRRLISEVWDSCYLFIVISV